MTTTNKQNDKSFNLKLYPIYKMFSWDLLFYYAISFLFLSNVKGISAANIILTDAYYTIFKIIAQIPCTTMLAKFGNKKSLLIGNSLIVVYLIMIILAPNGFFIRFAYLFAAIGFVFKSTAESTLLFDSIPSTSVSTDKTNTFAKIDSKGSSRFFYLEGLTAIASGFLYVVNPYIPILLCLGVALFSIYLTTKFVSSEKPTEIKENKSSVFKEFSDYIKELKVGFKYIFRSNRLKALIIFYALFSAYISLSNNFRKSLLQDLNITSQQLGIIFGVLSIISGLSSQYQNIFHKKLKNKTLSFLAMPFALAALTIGLVSNSNLPPNIILTAVLFLYGIQYFTRGPLYTLIKRYLGNFSNSSLRAKIYAVSDLTESIFRALLSIVGAKLLGATNTSIAFIISGGLFTLATIFILERMKSRVGLKPEEYDKKDITYTEVK